MNILQEFAIQDRKYICMQKIIIESKMIYICKELDSNEKKYFKENTKGNLEETNDENIKSKIEELIHAKSEDVSN